MSRGGRLVAGEGPARKDPHTGECMGISWLCDNCEHEQHASRTCSPPPPTDIQPPPCYYVFQCPCLAERGRLLLCHPPKNHFDAAGSSRIQSGTAWDANSVDLVYLGAIGGMRLHQNYDLYDITQSVNPRGKLYRHSADRLFLIQQVSGEKRGRSSREDGNILHLLGCHRG